MSLMFYLYLILILNENYIKVNLNLLINYNNIKAFFYDRKIFRYIKNMINNNYNKIGQQKQQSIDSYYYNYNYFCSIIYVRACVCVYNN